MPAMRTVVGAEPNLRDVVVTLSTHLVDGRPGCR